MNKISFTPFPVILTERLSLRKMEMDDNTEVFKLRSDEEVSRYIDRKLYKTLDEANEYIQRMNKGIKNNDFIVWAITLKGEDKLIGSICLWNMELSEEKVEVGYELMVDYQGMGIMGEALKSVIKYAFDDLGFKEIIAYGFQDNNNSIKLLERNNFIKDEKFKEVETLDGGKLELLIFTLKK